MNTYREKMRLFFIIILVFNFVASAAHADQLIRRFEDWLIMKTEGQNSSQSYCYMVSQPFRSKAFAQKKLRSPRFSILYLGKNEYTIQVDVDYDSLGSDTTITIDNFDRKLDMSIKEGISHTYSSTQDVAIINDLIRACGYFTVKSYDANSNSTVDYYSLKGFSKAIKKMSRICN